MRFKSTLLFDLLCYVAAIVLCLAVISMQFAHAEIKVVQKGYYEVWCNDAKFSQHQTYHKALETAANQPATCVLRSPEISVEVFGTTSNEQPAVDVESLRVTAQWTAPDTRANGAALALSELSHFNIYSTRDDGKTMSKLQVLVENGVTDYHREYLLAPGKWSFSATAVDKKGLESAMSISVAMQLPKTPEPVAPN